ncbi:MAG: TonB-dependent receptor [Marinilabiliales bacterium]|nr:MAG: TonB-dependent receptor [Marinilabiliales bacterium]
MTRIARISIIAAVILTILVPVSATAQGYVVTGTVSDAETGETLVGATVFVPDIQFGVVTGPEGNYRLPLPDGQYRVIFSFVGYENYEAVVDPQISALDAELRVSSVSLDEVVVSARQADRNVERAEMSTIAVSMEAIRNVPAFLGEVDVLRTIQLLPGVQSAGDGNTGFFVRGGDADQNMVLFDNAMVYNASHLFNFFSVFNPDAVADIRLYKGGIPPSYGGRLSSVLDVEMRSGSMDEYGFTGGIGLISSRISAEGPIQEGRSSFLVAGRRTYADLFLRLSPDENQRDSRLWFYDLNTRMNYVVNERNRIFLSAYHGKDLTAFSDLFGFDWGNSTGSLRWNSTFSDNFAGNFSLLYSNYRFNITGDVGPASFRWQSDIDNVNLRADFNYFSDTGSTLSFGAGTVLHMLDPGTIRAELTGASSTTAELTPGYALEHGIYINNEQSFFDNRLLVVYGVRGSLFQVLGPGKQYVFDRSAPQAWEVADTVILERGNIYESFGGLEPRVSLRVSTGPGSSVKASYNRMIQYIQQAQGSQSVAPYDVWYMSSNNIPPQVADQVAVGYFRNFLGNRVETSVELYYKDMSAISDVIDNGDILGNELLEGQLRVGDGWSYGAEFLVRKDEGRFSGFAGYTWSRTRRQIDGINEGRPYYAPNDRRHDLSLTGGYSITPAVSVSMSFVYATGRAFTLPEGKMFYQGAFAPVYAERNSSRLPAYHRLDLSVTYTPQRRGLNRRFSGDWNFSVFNVYGRVNPISVSFAEDADRPGIPRSSFFYIPGPVPAVTYNFKF